MTQLPQRLEAKLLYRRLDGLFGAFDPSRPQKKVLQAFLGRGLSRPPRGSALEERPALRRGAGRLFARPNRSATAVRRPRRWWRRGSETLALDLPPPRLYLRGSGRAGLAVRDGHAALRAGGGAGGRQAAQAARALLPARRGLGARGGGLRSQHGARRPGVAAHGRARPRFLQGGGGDPAEPPRGGAPGVRGLRSRLPLDTRGGGGRRLLRLPGFRRRDARASRSATRADTAFPPPCWCATWSRVFAWGSRRS